jgi:hypothetical protein
MTSTFDTFSVSSIQDVPKWSDSNKQDRFCLPGLVGLNGRDGLPGQPGLTGLTGDPGKIHLDIHLPPTNTCDNYQSIFNSRPYTEPENDNWDEKLVLPIAPFVAEDHNKKIADNFLGPIRPIFGPEFTIISPPQYVPPSVPSVTSVSCAPFGNNFPTEIEKITVYTDESVDKDVTADLSFAADNIRKLLSPGSLNVTRFNNESKPTEESTVNTDEDDTNVPPKSDIGACCSMEKMYLHAFNSNVVVGNDEGVHGKKVTVYLPSKVPIGTRITIKSLCNHNLNVQTRKGNFYSSGAAVIQAKGCVPFVYGSNGWTVLKI